MNKLRFRLSHHQVEEGTLSVGQELITMRVIEELQSMLSECFTGAIEDANGFAAGLFVKWILVRNPGAADVFQTESLRVPRHVFDMVATLIIRKVAADGLQSPGVKFRSEFLWSETISSVCFDVLNAKGANLVQSCRNIFGELVTQAVELKTDRSFEAGPNSG